MTRRQEGWLFVVLAVVALFGWVLSPAVGLIGCGLLVAAFVIVALRS